MPDPPGSRRATMLLWAVDETAGFDSAWASMMDGRLRAEGRAVALSGRPYWIDYELETGDDFVHRRITVTARSEEGTTSTDLQRDGDGRWTVDGKPRPDLDGAVDCDLAACPLTNTMPVLRHRLHRSPGDFEFLMAFIEVPDLRVDTSPQRYTHLGTTADGGGIVRYRSGSFQADITFDADGFVVTYPGLGRLVVADVG